MLVAECVTANAANLKTNVRNVGRLKRARLQPRKTLGETASCGRVFLHAAAATPRCPSGRFDRARPSDVRMSGAITVSRVTIRARTRALARVPAGRRVFSAVACIRFPPLYAVPGFSNRISRSSKGVFHGFHARVAVTPRVTNAGAPNTEYCWDREPEMSLIISSLFPPLSSAPARLIPRSASRSFPRIEF